MSELHVTTYVPARERLAREGYRGIAALPVLEALLVADRHYQPNPWHTLDDIKAAELDAVGYKRAVLTGVVYRDDERGPRVAANDVSFGEPDPGERLYGCVVFAGTEPLLFHPCALDERGRGRGTTGGAVVFEWADGNVLCAHPPGRPAPGARASARGGTPPPGAIDLTGLYRARNLGAPDVRRPVR